MHDSDWEYQVFLFFSKFNMIKAEPGQSKAEWARWLVSPGWQRVNSPSNKDNNKVLGLTGQTQQSTQQQDTQEQAAEQMDIHGWGRRLFFLLNYNIEIATRHWQVDALYVWNDYFAIVITMSACGGHLCQNSIFAAQTYKTRAQ